MSIINEQNILGNPELADANRPGSDVTIADYSFGTMSGLYEKIVHEAMGLARGGDWTQPTPYSGEVAQAEVEKESGTEETGPAGDPTQSMPTRYGVQGWAPLTDNSTMKTKNTQVATIIAGEADANDFVNSTSSAVRSEMNKEESVQGAASSGGPSTGYEATNPYEGWGNYNDGRGATTEPALIENTGVRQFVYPAPTRSGSNSNDNPMPDGPRTRKRGKKAKSNSKSGAMPDPNRVPRRSHTARSGAGGGNAARERMMASMMNP